MPARRQPGALPALLSLGAALAACRSGGLPAEGEPDGGGDAAGLCFECHGEAPSAAPPRAIGGDTDTGSRGVGAHRRHLFPAGTDGFRPVACDECHVVPADLFDEGHISMRPADLTFGPLASRGGLAPSFNGIRCRDVYCHGASLGAGGSLTAPRWTTVDGTQAACGTCHAVPPPPPHPAMAADLELCRGCHPAHFERPGEVHVNGEIDVLGGACDSCHGSARNAAPPSDLAGGSDTSEVGVGAHQSHLAPADWHAEVACADCHVVPSVYSDPGHADTALPAELAWSDRATGTGETAPVFDGATESCADVYCHGATLDGGTVAEPAWTVVDGTQAACGACHGLPPTGGHPVVLAGSCSLCHGEVIGPDGSWVDGGRHIDGVVDVRIDGCDSCHGSDGYPAPPADLEGRSDTSFRGVGAHRSHLALGSPWRRDLACPECHLVPSTMDTPGHLDSAAPAELVWGELATAGGTEPAWDGSRCANVYCHGASLSGGSGTSPTWTTVDGTQAACGTCHGLPPSTPHPPAPDCNHCHPSVAGPGPTIVGPAFHVNGRTDF
ncbi:MAG: CxxxxCH/CxxCH domain-containing protein [Deltaproteobacteria bacterium]|nr:CxxxxCH/CxxCH domain-containing protein [Deltaproteobacteria bacterium]